MTDAPAPRPRLAIAMLLLVCLIWAGAYTGLEMGLRPLQELSPGGNRLAVSALFLTARFALAALLMPLVLPAALRHLNVRNLLYGAALGLCFSLHLLAQLVGMSFEGMEPGKAAFLTALFVVFAPLVALVFQKRRPRTGVLIGIPFAVTGAMFIEGPPEAGLSLAAWLNVIAALIYAVQIVVTDTVTRRGNVLGQTFAMIVSCAMICGLAFAMAPGAGEVAADPGLGGALADARFWGSELYLALISTVVALALVNRWQREVSPNHAAILFTSTPVFAALISMAAGLESPTWWLLFGAGMILAANLSAEFIGRKQNRPGGAGAVAESKPSGT